MPAMTMRKRAPSVWVSLCAFACRGMDAINETFLPKGLTRVGYG
jgi:hypothetical protein